MAIRKIHWKKYIKALAKLYSIILWSTKVSHKNIVFIVTTLWPLVLYCIVVFEVRKLSQFDPVNFTLPDYHRTQYSY